MKFAEVAENVKQLVETPPAQDEFVYALLLAYGTPKATIARLKKGQTNLSKVPGEVLLKKKVWFRSVSGAETHPAVPAPLQRRGTDTEKIPSTGGVAAGRGGSDVEIPSMGGVAAGRGGSELFATIEEMKTTKAAKTNGPRFLIVTDFEQLLAVDRKIGDTLDTDFQGLETHSEKTMAQLYDPDTTKRSEKECHRVTGQRPTSPRGVQMPSGLRAAHHQLDLAIDRIYRSKPFASDEERLEHLFKLYEDLSNSESAFEFTQKKRPKRNGK